MGLHAGACSTFSLKGIIYMVPIRTIITLSILWIINAVFITPSLAGVPFSPSRVPLYYQSMTLSDGEKLYYYLFKTTNSNKKGTIVYNPGGPGGAGISSGEKKIWPQAIKDNFDILIFDPRATGFGYNHNAAQNNYTKISTHQNVEDLNELRKHLNIDKLHLYGTSYGTAFFTAYSIRYPEHVAAILLASPVSPNYPEDTMPLQDAFRPTYISAMDILYSSVTGETLEQSYWSDEQIERFFLQGPATYPQHILSTDTFFATLCNDFSNIHAFYQHCALNNINTSFNNTSLQTKGISLLKAGSNLNAPVLIIVNEYDSKTPISGGLKLFRKFQEKYVDVHLVIRENSIFHGSLYEIPSISSSIEHIATSFLLHGSVVSTPDTCTTEPYEPSVTRCETLTESTDYLHNILIPSVDNAF